MTRGTQKAQGVSLRNFHAHFFIEENNAPSYVAQLVNFAKHDRFSDRTSHPRHV